MTSQTFYLVGWLVYVITVLVFPVFSTGLHCGPTLPRCST